MRVLHLQLSDGPVEIHPYVTVLRGASPAARQELLDVFAALPRGRALVPGLVEAHGVLLDLDDAALAMLDLRHDLEAVVRRTDLPHGNGASPASVAAAERQVDEARARLRAAETALARAVAARDEVAEALERLDAGGAGHGLSLAPEAGADPSSGDRPRLEAAAARAAQLRQRAAEALGSAREEAAAASAEHRAAQGRLHAAEAALEAATERRDPTVAAGIEAARRRVAEAEAALDAARAGESAATEVAGSIEQLKEERLAVEAALLALETTDPLPVRLALHDLESSRRGALVASPEALELAERWAILQVDLERVGGLEVDDGPDAVERRAAARRRLVDAETELARMEAASRRPILDPDDVAELERAHEEVLQAREAADKRFGAGRASQRLDEAMSAEQAVLARLGFVSWADFRLGAPSASVSTEDELAERLARAQRELHHAQAEHDALERSIDAELLKAEVLDRRRLLRAQVLDVLGYDPGDDVEGTLRRHRIAVEDTGAHLDRLRAALDGAGLVLDGEDLDEQVLVDLATMWLREQAETEQRRADLESQLAEVDVRLAQLQASERSEVLGEPVVGAAAVLDDARAALAAAEERASADAATASAIEHLRHEFEAANDAERDASHRVLRADEQVLAAEAMLRAAEEEVRRGGDVLAGFEEADQAAAQAAWDRAERHAQLAAAAGDVHALEAALERAFDDIDAAREVYAERGREVGAALAALGAARAAVPERALDVDDVAVAVGERDGPGGDTSTGEPGAAEDLEWYLLARLAAQRSVSYAGSVPLVLDDTLAGLDAASSHRVLERLERMASTVQVVILTEDLAAASWAESLGTERALVVQR